MRRTVPAPIHIVHGGPGWDCLERQAERAHGGLEHGALSGDHARQERQRVEGVGHRGMRQLPARPRLGHHLLQPLRLLGSAAPHRLQFSYDVRQLGDHFDLVADAVPHCIPLRLGYQRLHKRLVHFGRPRPKVLVLPLGEEIPVEMHAKDGVADRPLDKELRQLGLIRRLVSQRLHQLQQVVAKLVVLCPLEHLHRVAPDLLVDEIRRQQLQSIGDVNGRPLLHQLGRLGQRSMHTVVGGRSIEGARGKGGHARTCLASWASLQSTLLRNLVSALRSVVRLNRKRHSSPFCSTVSGRLGGCLRMAAICRRSSVSGFRSRSITPRVRLRASF
mmetsp:Transcript_3714/g.9518  ORF Transcript_3714/g.9518 Transcript_3714/m.9518 type:complete len:331 (-) Transcript_3714:370-1362(-)